MKATIEQLEKTIVKTFGLQPVEVPARATQQSKIFYDKKKDVAFITFKNGHIARTVKGLSGKRFSLNPISEGARKLIKTEPARLNRLVEYLEANSK